MDQPKPKDVAVAITITMKDGSRFVSVDAECADEVWKWWRGCEVMAHNHSMRYKGRTLTRLEPERHIARHDENGDEQ